MVKLNLITIIFIITILNTVNAEAQFYEPDVLSVIEAVKWTEKSMEGGFVQFKGRSIEVSSLDIDTNGDVLIKYKNGYSKFNFRNIEGYVFRLLFCSSDRKCINNLTNSGASISVFDGMILYPKYDTDQARFSINIGGINNYFHGRKGEWWADYQKSQTKPNLPSGCFMHDGQQFCNKK